MHHYGKGILRFLLCAALIAVLQVHATDANSSSTADMVTWAATKSNPAMIAIADRVRKELAGSGSYARIIRRLKQSDEETMIAEIGVLRTIRAEQAAGTVKWSADEIEASLELISAQYPAELLGTFWGKHPPVLNTTRDVPLFMRALHANIDTLEGKIRYYNLFLKNFPVGWSKLAHDESISSSRFGHQFDQRFENCSRLAEAMMLGATDTARQLFPICIGPRYNTQGMLTFGAILMDFTGQGEHLIDVRSILPRQQTLHWILERKAFDGSLLHGARGIVQLHRQLQTAPWKRLLPWLMGGEALPEDIIQRLPLATVSLLLFEMRLYRMPQKLVDFPSGLWERHPAATQLLRIMEEPRDPIKIFDDFDKNVRVATSFPRRGRSPNRIQDDREGLATALLQLYCYLPLERTPEIQQTCQTLNGLAVHPMVPVHLAMAQAAFAISSIPLTMQPLAIMRVLPLEKMAKGSPMIYTPTWKGPLPDILSPKRPKVRPFSEMIGEIEDESLWDPTIVQVTDEDATGREIVADIETRTQPVQMMVRKLQEKGFSGQSINALVMQMDSIERGKQDQIAQSMLGTMDQGKTPDLELLVQRLSLQQQQEQQQKQQQQLIEQQLQEQQLQQLQQEKLKQHKQQVDQIPYQQQSNVYGVTIPLTQTDTAPRSTLLKIGNDVIDQLDLVDHEKRRMKEELQRLDDNHVRQRIANMQLQTGNTINPNQRWGDSSSDWQTTGGTQQTNKTLSSFDALSPGITSSHHQQNQYQNQQKQQQQQQQQQYQKAYDGSKGNRDEYERKDTGSKEDLLERTAKNLADQGLSSTNLFNKQSIPAILATLQSIPSDNRTDSTYYRAGVLRSPRLYQIYRRLREFLPCNRLDNLLRQIANYPMEQIKRMENKLPKKDPGNEAEAHEFLLKMLYPELLDMGSLELDAKNLIPSITRLLQMTGKLTKEQLDFLKTRGLSQEEAKKILDDLLNVSIGKVTNMSDTLLRAYDGILKSLSNLHLADFLPNFTGLPKIPCFSVTDCLARLRDFLPNYVADQAIKYNVVNEEGGTLLRDSFSKLGLDVDPIEWGSNLLAGLWDGLETVTNAPSDLASSYLNSLGSWFKLRWLSPDTVNNDTFDPHKWNSSDGREQILRSIQKISPRGGKDLVEELSTYNNADLITHVNESLEEALKRSHGTDTDELDLSLVMAIANKSPTIGRNLQRKHSNNKFIQQATSILGVPGNDESISGLQHIADQAGIKLDTDHMNREEAKSLWSMIKSFLPPGISSLCPSQESLLGLMMNLIPGARWFRPDFFTADSTPKSVLERMVHAQLKGDRQDDHLIQEYQAILSEIDDELLEEILKKGQRGFTPRELIDKALWMQIQRDLQSPGKGNRGRELYSKLCFLRGQEVPLDMVPDYHVLRNIIDDRPTDNINEGMEAFLLGSSELEMFLREAGETRLIVPLITFVPPEERYRLGRHISSMNQQDALGIIRWRLWNYWQSNDNFILISEARQWMLNTIADHVMTWSDETLFNHPYYGNMLMDYLLEPPTN
jgi:hypothetical protein